MHLSLIHISCRDEERSEGDVVFQEKLEIGAVEAVGVEALRPVAVSYTHLN